MLLEERAPYILNLSAFEFSLVFSSTEEPRLEHFSTKIPVLCYMTEIKTG